MILSLLIHVTSEQKSPGIRMQSGCGVFSLGGFIYIYLWLNTTQQYVNEEISIHFNRQICTSVCPDSTKSCQEKNLRNHIDSCVHVALICIT